MKARVKPVITKYLECYAEPEASVGTQLPNNVNHVLVIPAHNEASNLLARLRPALDQAANRGRRTLVIIVINARDSDSSVIHLGLGPLVRAGLVPAQLITNKSKVIIDISLVIFFILKPHFVSINEN